MNYSKIEAALQQVLPEAVYKVQAPEIGTDGQPLTRYLVWTPTGNRPIFAEGVAFADIGLVVVTVATQTEDDALVSQVLATLHGTSGVAVGQSEQSFDAATMTYYTDIPCEVI